jgi:hypothetical protein
LISDKSESLVPTDFGQGDALSDLREFLKDIEENLPLRATATLRAMDRPCDALLLNEETA